MDCTRVNGTMFCSLCSEVTNRASLLAIAGLSAEADIDVFVHERAWARGAQDAIGVQTGYCATFVPLQHPAFTVAYLADILHDPLAWNLGAAIPILHGRWVYLLTDDEPCPVLPSPQRVLPARVEFAALLGYNLQRIVLQPSHPPLRNHFDRGILSDTVIIASQMVARDEDNVLYEYVLDMRPVLCGITWGVARRGRVATRPILDRFRRVCPQGMQPCCAVAGPRLADILLVLRCPRARSFLCTLLWQPARKQDPRPQMSLRNTLVTATVPLMMQRLGMETPAVTPRPPAEVVQRRTTTEPRKGLVQWSAADPQEERLACWRMGPLLTSDTCTLAHNSELKCGAGFLCVLSFVQDRPASALSSCYLRCVDS